MKKLVLLLMLVYLTGCFIACGKNEVSKTENNSQDVVSEDNQETKNTDDNEPTESNKKRK